MSSSTFEAAKVAAQPSSANVALDDLSVPIAPPAHPEWGSDVVVEMLHRIGIEFIALTPGASFRGLHDSLVNYNGNRQPGIILCNHEEVAVAVAHGYAKATGRAMAAGLHTNIGLLHGSMAMFNAFCDRMPVVILGGTGPMDSTNRRPGVDWHHTSNGIGSVVRDFTKWEQQPAAVAAIPEAMLRAWHLANTEPRGPVYLSLDAGIQETHLNQPIEMPDVSRYPLPVPVAPPLEAVRTAAQWLTTADAPVILLGQTGQTGEAWGQLVELAELLAAAVLQDSTDIASFPTNHFLAQSSHGPSRRDEYNDVIGQADVVLNLDFATVAGALRNAASGRSNHYQNLSEGPKEGAKPTPKLIHVSLDHFAVRSWAADFQELAPADLAISANVELTVAALVEAVRRELRDHPARLRRAEERSGKLRARRAQLEAGWQARVAARWDLAPLSVERMVSEVVSALGQDYQHAVVTRIPNTWASGVWNFTKPLSFLGKDGGGGLGSAMGMAVGSALGLRDSGRPVVAFLGDGDALFAPSALWTAAHHQVPVLFVVANNQSYYNDEEHQAHVARTRGRPVENRWIGMRLDEPPVDYAGLSRSLGVEAFGPVVNPGDLAVACVAAVQRLRRGEPVLIDVHISQA